MLRRRLEETEGEKDFHQPPFHRIVTIAVNSFLFKQPVMIGDLVSFYAEVVKVGRTSITVDVEVYAQRRSLHETVKVTEATLTYVAVDNERRPRPLSGP